MSPLLRQLLAVPALAAHRLSLALTSGEPGLRLVLLHDLPPAEMIALASLVRHLAKTGQLASPAQLERVLAGTEAGGGRIAFSFDDGFASNLEAANILEAEGARGLFFVCPGLTDLPWPAQRAAIAANVFDGKRRAEDIPERLRLMGWDDLRALAARGHVIANHTMRHRRLTLLSPAEIEAEIGEAATRLTAELGAPGQWFAFPFGDIDSIDAAALSVAGRFHHFCRSGIRGGNGAATHRLGVLADHVDLAAPRSYQLLAVEGGLDRRYAEASRRLAEMVTQA